MLISLILPCFNPPEKWAENIAENYRALTTLIHEPIELILVEDGADTNLEAGMELLKQTIPSFKNIQYKINQGKGFAIRQGVKVAEGEIILYTDIDFPYTIESVYKIYSALKNKECDLAVGIKNDAYYDNVPLARKILSKGFRKLIRFFLSIPITDTQCGLKGFVKEIKPTFLKTTIHRYLFDLEFIRNAYALKHKILAVQIELNKNVQFRSMNYRILIPEAINFSKLLFKSTTHD